MAAPAKLADLELEATLSSVEGLVNKRMTDLATLRRQLARAERRADQNEDCREALHDLLMLRGESQAIGGGPGWQERDAKAWARAWEIFEP